tara:strand:+ start:247 stop:486 length:240 start_codon:yes stop_codon:yes gene_type:complete
MNKRILFFRILFLAFFLNAIFHLSKAYISERSKPKPDVVICEFQNGYIVRRGLNIQGRVCSKKYYKVWTGKEFLILRRD